jgi:hypothetical protein
MPAAVKDPCDDTVISRIIAPLIVTSAFAHKGPAAVASFVDDGESLRVLLAVQREDKQFYYAIPVGLHPATIGPQPDGSYVWALVQLGATVWEVMPSVHIPGQLHAYVTLVNVPWDQQWHV